MKLIVFLLTFFAASLGYCGETTISGTQGGHPLSVPGDQTPQLEKLAAVLLTSSDYEAPGRIATEDRWRQALGASHIHLVFSEPRKFSFRFSTTGPANIQEVSAEEILIPISHESSPDYILVRFHDHIRAFAKYHDTEALSGLQKMLPSHPEP